MQKLTSNLFLIIVLTLFSAPLAAQNNSTILKQADSLFQNKRFTQSMLLYDSLINQNLYTPSMLLKMSYINEGLDKHAESLYYLNLYYLITTDEDALEKMEAMGEEYGLMGYQANEKELAFTFYYRYFSEIIFTLVALCLILVIIAFYLRFKSNKTPYWAAIGFVMISAIIFYLVNYGRSYDQGIITSKNAYLMTGASPGSSLYEIAGEGHKVRILGNEDVWVKIKWEEKTLYIKENHIKPIGIYN